MKYLLMNLTGITETKIAVLNMLIKLCDKNGGYLGKGDLQYIKNELIEIAGHNEIADALDNLKGKEKEE